MTMDSFIFLVSLSQNSGKAFSSVSRSNCSLVFAPHIGHRTHCFSSLSPSLMSSLPSCTQIPSDE